MPPLRKEGHIALHMPVDWSVCQSVSHLFSKDNSRTFNSKDFILGGTSLVTRLFLLKVRSVDQIQGQRSSLSYIC